MHSEPLFESPLRVVSPETPFEDLTWTAFTSDDEPSSLDPLLARIGALPELSQALSLPQPGDVLGEAYEILGPLASGGMSSVMLARDLRLGRTVVIKLIRFGARLTPDRLLLFEREARATARLQHPNIVTIHAFGLWRGTPFMVLEHLKGQALSERLASTPKLSVEESTDIMLQVLGGLGHAHTVGIVHRDLKPGNIFLEDTGRVLLLDFGVAELDPKRLDLLDALRDSGAHEELLAPGPRFAGTPAYMAPEQLRSEAADSRADVWAAGTLMFQMLSGHLPMRTVGEVLDPSVPIPNLEEVPGALEVWVARALCRTASDRPEDATVLTESLERASGRIRAERTHRARRRKLFLFSFLTLIALAALAGWGYHVAKQDALHAARAESAAKSAAEKAERERALAVESVQQLHREQRLARSAELAGTSRGVVDSDPALALELAYAATLHESSPEAIDALFLALSKHHERVRIPGHALAISADQRHVVIKRGEETALWSFDHPDSTLR